MDAGVPALLVLVVAGVIGWLLLRKLRVRAARKCLNRNVSSALRTGQDNAPPLC
jgi:hypothetical protein